MHLPADRDHGSRYRQCVNPPLILFSPILIGYKVLYPHCQNTEPLSHSLWLVAGDTKVGTDRRNRVHMSMLLVFEDVFTLIGLPVLISICIMKAI